MQRHRTGLTLVEVVVAILLFSIGALGLAASTAVLTRQMAASVSRSRSAYDARSRDETAHAYECAGLTSGQSSGEGISSSWAVTGGSVGTLSQTIQRQSISGLHADLYLSAFPCR